MEEIWKDIEGYNGDYKVSSLGNIRSFKRNKIIHLKPILKNNGYYQVTLHFKGMQKTEHIHSLVAKHFLMFNKINNYLVVDHINNIKTDNRAVNLQITTQRFNCIKNMSRGNYKFTGVCSDGIYGMFRAQISIAGQKCYLGNYTTEEKAFEAYKTAWSNEHLYNGDDTEFRAYIKSLIIR